MRKAVVFIGAFLLCSFTILAGGNDNFEKDFDNEFKILVGQDDNSGYLGVYLRDLQPGDVEEQGLPAEKGVFLTGITEESPAEKSGLIKGDVIVEYQSMPVLSVKQFQRMVGDTPQGRNVNISLYRDKKKMNLAVEIGSAESSIHRIRKFNMSAPAPADKDKIYRFYQGFADGFSDGLRDHLPGNTQYFLRKGLVLGLEGAAMTEQMADYMGIDDSEGVLVTAVSQDSAAEVAGIRAGDVIIAVNGDKVRDPRELRNSLEKGTLELELVRDRKKISLEAEITPPKAPKVRKEKLRM